MPEGAKHITPNGIENNMWLFPPNGKERPVKFRPWEDNIDPRTIPHEVLLSELGRRNSAKRKTFASGPGRPSKGGPRCACGKYALATAQKYHHHCPRLVEVREEGDKIFELSADQAKTTVESPPFTRPVAPAEPAEREPPDILRAPISVPMRPRESRPSVQCPLCGGARGSNELSCFECLLTRRRASGGF